MPQTPIAILGGTFDPVHNGHLRVAWEAAEALEADVHLMPAHVPPHRPAPIATRATVVQCRHAARAARRGRPGAVADPADRCRCVCRPCDLARVACPVRARAPGRADAARLLERSPSRTAGASACPANAGLPVVARAAGRARRGLARHRLGHFGERGARAARLRTRTALARTRSIACRSVPAGAVSRGRRTLNGARMERATRMATRADGPDRRPARATSAATKSAYIRARGVVPPMFPHEVHRVWPAQ